MCKGTRLPRKESIALEEAATAPAAAQRRRRSGGGAAAVNEPARRGSDGRAWVSDGGAAPFGGLGATEERPGGTFLRFAWQRPRYAETSGLWFWPIKNDHRNWRPVFPKFPSFHLLPTCRVGRRCRAARTRTPKTMPMALLAPLRRLNRLHARRLKVLPRLTGRARSALGKLANPARFAWTR
jgi:hypothetical protein